MEDTDDSVGQSGVGSKSKVAKLIQEYDISAIGEELETYWTLETDDRMSLRALADYFNKELLAQELQQETTNILEGEVENYYQLLTDDNVSRGTRVQAKNQLKQEGIDVENLLSDFVSRQAIHTYLTSERNAIYDTPDESDETRVENRINSIGRLKNRLVAVAEQAISDLARLNQVSNSETRVTVLVQVHCVDCGRQYPITEFLTNGGCDC